MPEFVGTYTGMTPKAAGNPSYNYCKRNNSDERYRKIVEAVDNRFKDLKLKLIGFRTIEKKPEYNSIICEAVVTSETGVVVQQSLFDISYSAQLTDDKKEVYVKLLTIKPSDLGKGNQ